MSDGLYYQVVMITRTCAVFVTNTLTLIMRNMDNPDKYNCNESILVQVKLQGTISSSSGNYYKLSILSKETLSHMTVTFLLDDR